MKCKPEIWEAARRPDEYGRRPSYVGVELNANAISQEVSPFRLTPVQFISTS